MDMLKIRLEMRVNRCVPNASMVSVPDPKNVNVMLAFLDLHVTYVSFDFFFFFTLNVT